MRKHPAIKLTLELGDLVNLTTAAKGAYGIKNIREVRAALNLAQKSLTKCKELARKVEGGKK